MAKENITIKINDKEVYPQSKVTYTSANLDLKMNKGDYIVATKYKDGMPNDHFVVGFFRDMTWHNRYNVVDEEGKLFRHNGFRRAKKISKEVGKLIVDNIKNIEMSEKSIWDFVSEYEKMTIN